MSAYTYLTACRRCTHTHTHTQVLIDAKADVKHASNDGSTGLTRAAMGGHEKTVKVRSDQRYGQVVEYMGGGKERRGGRDARGTRVSLCV